MGLYCSFLLTRLFESAVYTLARITPTVVGTWAHAANARLIEGCLLQWFKDVDKSHNSSPYFIFAGELVGLWFLCATGGLQVARESYDGMFSRSQTPWEVFVATGACASLAPIFGASSG